MLTRINVSWRKATVELEVGGYSNGWRSRKIELVKKRSRKRRSVGSVLNSHYGRVDRGSFEQESRRNRPEWILRRGVGGTIGTMMASVP